MNAEVACSLLGVLGKHDANQALLVGTSGFARSVHDEAGSDVRLSLLGGDDLIFDLNLRLGSDWPNRLERILTMELQALAHD